MATEKMVTLVDHTGKKTIQRTEKEAEKMLKSCKALKRPNLWKIVPGGK